MNKRIAKKIVRSLRGPECRRYSVDQVRRALLRVYWSPLQLTDRYEHWLDDGFRMPLSTFGRCMVLTDKLCILEQRGPLHDVRRREGRLEFHRRPLDWSELRINDTHRRQRNDRSRDRRSQTVDPDRH